MTKHLKTKSSDRGFAALMPLGTAQEAVSVHESSAALRPAIWLNVRAPETPMDEKGNIVGETKIVEVSTQLDADTAWHLAEQLMTMVKNHYQGDARPPLEERAADLLPTQP